MIEWTDASNGHLLVIKMDKDALHKQMQDKIQEWKQALTDPESSELYPEERCRMTYTNEEFMSIEECIADMERLDKAIDDFAEKDANEVIAMYPTKKNGTFKRSVKPRIDILNFGTLYEEGYGWNTTELRIMAVNDTEAVVELNRTTIKW